MLALGVILVLLAIGVAAGAVAGTADDSAMVTMLGFDTETTTMAIFLMGCATVVVLALGLVLARVGASRARQRRRDSKEVKRLSAQLERAEHGSKPTAPPGQQPRGPAGPGTTH